MLRIDVSLGLPFLMSGVTRASRAAIASLLHLWLVSGLCVPALCHSIACLRCSILCRDLHFSAFKVKHCRRNGAVSATPCKDRLCYAAHILSGSPLLCRCSTFGGNFPSHNCLVCIITAAFSNGCSPGILWRSAAILPTHIVAFVKICSAISLRLFSHISCFDFYSIRQCHSTHVSLLSAG